MKKRLILLLLALAVWLPAGMLLVSCSGDDGNSTTETSAQPSDTQPQEDTAPSTLPPTTETPVPKLKVNFYADAEMSDEQGLDGWYYGYCKSGTNAVLPQPACNDGLWRTGDGWNTGVLGPNQMHPGDKKDSLLAFKAPYTGKVTIGLDNGASLADTKDQPNGGSDGASLGVYLYSGDSVTQIWPADSDQMAYIENGGSIDIEGLQIDVKKNEYICFRTGMAGAHNHFDGITVSPFIKYTEADENAAGIEERSIFTEVK